MANPKDGPGNIRAWRDGSESFESLTGVRAPGGPGGGRRRTVMVVAILAFLLLIVLPSAATRYTDWLWFREVGFERVFLLKIAAQWLLGLIVGVGGFLVLHFNARTALRALPATDIPSIDRIRTGDIDPAELLTRLARIASRPVTVLLAGFFGLAAAAQWRTVVQFWYRSPFGVSDPVFGRDVSYYVFTIPVVEMAIGFLSSLVFVSLVLVALPLYLARGELGVRAGRLFVGPLAAVHLGVLSAAWLLARAARLALVDVPGLLYESHDPLQGASYTDLTVRQPMLYVTAALAVVAAVLVLRAAWTGRFGRVAVATLGGFFLLSVVLLGVAPAAFQRLAVQPNELAREAPQLRHHIDATRRAWGLDSVARRELGSEEDLTSADIAANQATVSNVRLWDRAPLLQTFGQIQAIRTYYDFVAVDDDRYRINGELRQVMLSARELNTAALPTRTFINEHLTFTHGMGLTLGPSNQVTEQGLPVLWLKDLPPASSVNVRVTRPQIYFGELSNEFVLAPTRQREFDYPSGEGDAAVYSQYTGTAGVPSGSLGRRLLFALRFRSLNIVLSGDLSSETRVLFYRNIRQRAGLALPFLRFDSDPYLVVTDSGQLKWMLDAYTTTDRYPYSQRLADGTNYMRNSVKVVIDAYDGDIRAYLADPADPMIRTLSKIYPGLLRPLAEMPADLRAHMRYPQDLFSVQSSLYATFHMTNPETFYHREDQWQVPRSAVASDGTEGGDEAGFMRHIVMRLPGEPEPEFILMRPFTPRQKDNLAAWMVARNDGANYGKLVAYRFPRQRLVFGPAQVVNRINQDTEVARQVSLWDQRGSEVIRGELLVIPIEGALIYVQPLYLRAQGGRIPELKRVIVVHESRVVMAETFEAGLGRLFGTSDAPATTGVPVRADSASPAAAPSAAPPSAPLPAETAALLRQAAEHYERARAAQRADDWATYGEEMRRLGEILSQLNRGR